MTNFTLEEAENQTLVRFHEKDYQSWRAWLQRLDNRLQVLNEHFTAFALSMDCTDPLDLEQIIASPERWAEGIINRKVQTLDKPLQSFYLIEYWKEYRAIEIHAVEFNRAFVVNDHRPYYDLTELPAIQDGKLNITDEYLEQMKRTYFETWTDSNDQLFKAFTAIKDNYLIIKEIGLNKGVIQPMPKVGPYAGIDLLTEIGFFLSNRDNTVSINTDNLKRLQA